MVANLTYKEVVDTYKTEIALLKAEVERLKAELDAEIKSSLDKVRMEIKLREGLEYLARRLAEPIGPRGQGECRNVIDAALKGE